MRTLTFIALLFTSTAFASSPAPLDLKFLLCEDAYIAVVGNYVGTKEKDYFVAAYGKNKYTYDLGEVKVESVLLNRRRFTYNSEPGQLPDKLQLLFRSKCEGDFCYGIFPPTKEKRIWVLHQMNPFTGNSLGDTHPELPLPMSKLKEVKKILSACPRDR